MSNDKVYIGTALNVDAEVGAGTYEPEHKFIIAHFWNDEPVAVEGFATKEAALAALESYHGAEIERLFVELCED